MTVSTVGIRELQQHSSSLVRDVEQGNVEYRITVQGRDTGVMLTKAAATRPRGVSLADVRRSGLWDSNLAQPAKDRLLEFIEAGRDEVGFVGQ